MLSSVPQKSVLLIKHSNTWSGDRCSAWFESHGFNLHWCYPCEGQALPNPNEFDVAVIYGGRNSVNDNEDWINEEARWLEGCLESRCKYLGICFGAQQLAKILGAQVWKHSHALKEIGFTPVQATGDDTQLLPLPEKLFQWHGDGFDVPSGAQLLASSERFPNQAFRFEKHYAVQFHPEVNHCVISQWFKSNTDYESEFLDPDSRAATLAYAQQHDDTISGWFDSFMQRWLGTT
ncbi:MAG: hypothetical protein AAF434_12855 [Pseudomonadota bacterium]